MLQNSQENTCARVYFLINMQLRPATLLKKETLAQLFSCEFCEISKTTFFIEHLQETAFVILFFNKFQYLFLAFLNMLVSRLLFAGKRSVFSVILRFVQTFLVIFLLLKVLINISYCLVLL